MGMDPHFRGHMMPMPYGMPPHPMGHPMMPHPVQMNPNVPQFIPSSQQQKREPQFQNQPIPAVRTQNNISEPPERPTGIRTGSASFGASAGNSPSSKTTSGDSQSTKPVSRRLPIIDPTTGQEISIKPVSALSSSVPASALVTADVAFGPSTSTTPKVLSRTATTDSTGGPVVPAVKSAVVAPEVGVPVQEEPPQEAEISAAPRSKLSKLKNVPLLKPKTSESIPGTDVSSAYGASETPPIHDVGGELKKLNRIKNVVLVRKQPTIDVSVTPPLDREVEVATQSKTSKFRLTNRTLSSTASNGTSRIVPVPIVPTIWPLSRELFLKYLPATRPDRNAPSSINVFPSELLGLRTAPYGDPGLARVISRRSGGGLQKTMSAVSTGSRDNAWRSNKLGRTLSRQSSRVKIGGIVRPSERGFKIVDQSSLSEKDKLRRQVMSLLNKLTVDSFGAITNQISEIEISQPWQMDVVIGLIFDKAVVEHKFSEMYAEMCKKLRTTWPELTGVDSETGAPVPVTFTRAIIEKCQVEFDAIPDTLEPTESEITRARGDPQDLEMFMLKKKERILGNMKFIAQLFLMRILSSRVVRSVVEQLLYRREEPEEHYIECVGILLHNIGSTLYETESGRAYISQFVEKMKDLCGRSNYGKRIKFLMKDVIDAAQVGWQGKHAASHLVATAKSKEAVRRDAQTEEQRQVVTTTGGVKRSGSSSGLGRQNPNNGWGRQNFKPISVLPRTSSSAVNSLKRRESIPEDEVVEDEWSDEEDEVSEYAPSSHGGDNDEEEGQESDDEGFTKVGGATGGSNRKRS
jgi:hypothetical protein